ncbi:MAG: hypothetical protein AAFQ07_14640 [Chloroflexota bacterium]
MNIEYVPPDDKQLRAYARRVCEKLYQETDEVGFKDRKVVDGFTGFVRLAASITAKSKNEK